MLEPSAHLECLLNIRKLRLLHPPAVLFKQSFIFLKEIQFSGFGAVMLHQ